MNRVFVRIVTAFVMALVLSSMGIEGNDDVLKILFAILGITFVASLTFTASIDLSNVLNAEIKKVIIWRIKEIKDAPILDFIVSALMAELTLTMTEAFSYSYLDCMLNLQIVLSAIVTISLFYQTYISCNLIRFNGDIQNAYLKEKIV